MDEQLDDAHAVVGQRALELVDLAVGALPFVLAAETLDPLDQHAAVPGAVEDRPVARRRAARVPEAPEDSAGPAPRRVGAPMRQTWIERGSRPKTMRWIRPPLPAASQPSMPIIARPPVRRWWTCRSSSWCCSFFELVLVVVVVERTVDHLDLVQRRPLAHRFLRAGSCQAGRRLTAARGATTNRRDGRASSHHPLCRARRRVRCSRSAAPGPCSACTACGSGSTRPAARRTGGRPRQGDAWSTPRTSSGSTRRARSRSCSLPAAPRPRSRPPRRAMPTCSRSCRTTCACRPSRGTSTGSPTGWRSSAATWSISASRSSTSAPSSARSSWSSSRPACSRKRFRIGAVVRQMFEVWIKALLIVGVLTFLIGVVIAYQGVQQLRQFGAETFTVEAVGIGMFRELGVLLTAIIVAGRSGSAFTAQIGTMQVNQEVDAMRTIGLNPIEWLVLPRILGAGAVDAAARLLGRHDRPAGRRGRLHGLSRLHLRAVLRPAARHGRHLAFLHRHDQGAGVRLHHRRDRLLRGPAGPAAAPRASASSPPARWSN